MIGIGSCLTLALAIGLEPAEHRSACSSPDSDPQGLNLHRQEDPYTAAKKLATRARAALWNEEEQDALELVALALETAVQGTGQMTAEEAAAVFGEIGAVARDADATLCAKQAFEHALQYQEDLLDPDDSDLQATRLALAWKRAELGDLAGARSLGLRELGSRQRTLAVGDFGLADASRSLALTLLEMGEYEGARSLLEKAVSDLGQGRPSEDPEFNALRVELAIALELAGERAAGIELFGEVLTESASWLIPNADAQQFESGPGWHWALGEMAMKLSFLGGRDSGQDVLSSLGPALEAANPLESEQLAVFRRALLAALAESGAGDESQPNVFVTIADAYANRLRGHCKGWLDVGTGGRAARLLHRASELGQVETVALLLERGIDPDVRCFDVAHWRPGEPYLDTRTALALAAGNNHFEVVRVLLSGGADPGHAAPGKMAPLAFAAAEEGCSGVVELLLTAGADPLQRDRRGWRAIEWAAMNGEYASFLLLLEAGRQAGMTLEDERGVAEFAAGLNSDLRHRMLAALSSEKPSPLHTAARSASAAELAELLLAGADPDVATKDYGWRPLHWAAGYEGDAELVRLLLDAGADPGAATFKGHTPLMAAAQAGFANHIHMLLEGGADPNAVDIDGTTALHIAAGESGPEVVTLLLEAGASITKQNRWTQTPRDCAEYRGQTEILRLMQEAWDRRPWPKTAGEIELVGAEREGASPGRLWSGEIECEDAPRGFRVRGNVWVENPTVPIAFRIYLKFKGEEHHVGYLAADMGEVRSFGYTNHLGGAAPKRVDIVLRPDREWALANLDTWKIWGEEVVLLDVEVPHDE